MLRIKRVRVYHGRMVRCESVVASYEMPWRGFSDSIKVPDNPKPAEL